MKSSHGFFSSYSYDRFVYKFKILALGIDRVSLVLHIHYFGSQKIVEFEVHFFLQNESKYIVGGSNIFCVVT